MRAQAPAPSYAELPASSRRVVRGGPAVCEITVRLEVVTPILGGGTQTRTVDDVDVIRAASVRGQLRFWWRALYSANCPTSKELYTRESGLWGRAAADEGGRSAVGIGIHIEQTSETDQSQIRLYDSKDGKATQGAYALWPAREERKTNTLTASRRTPGIRFRMTLLAPVDREGEVRNAVRAWLLFGGYGSRTRRGLGSFKVLDDPTSWLPSRATRDAITTLFDLDILATPGKVASDSPWLAGAALQVGKVERDAMKAWTTALDWLKEFRQGTTGQPGDRAREPGTGKPQPQRPSMSNWPEADKIRRIRGKTRSHPPVHNATPVWPRAGFGLPIIGQFQTKARDGGRLDEPGPFELRWRSGNTEHDRLASPLIVKAMPLADGRFAPCALWLNRAYPSGDVVLRGVNNSAAPFDLLKAPGDTARFSPLADKQSLREAFLDWLHARYQTTVVAP